VLVEFLQDTLWIYIQMLRAKFTPPYTNTTSLPKKKINLVKRNFSLNNLPI